MKPLQKEPRPRVSAMAWYARQLERVAVGKEFTRRAFMLQFAPSQPIFTAGQAKRAAALAIDKAVEAGTVVLVTKGISNRAGVPRSKAVYKKIR